MKIVKIRKSSSQIPVINVKYCDTFLSRLKGLMFSRKLEINSGIIIAENSESRMNTSIHMMFMNYDITVLWLDSRLVIVDKILARKWVPAYIPKEPAQYVVELHSSKFSEFSIGEKLTLINGD